MSSSSRILRSIAGCVVLLGACSPAPSHAPDALPPTPTFVLATLPPNLTPVPLSTAIASAEPLPTWAWVQAEVRDPPARGEIDHLWTLPGASIAAWSDETNDGGGTSTLFVSADGVNWELAPFAEPGFLAEHGTVVDGELTVIGNIGPAQDPERQVWTTTDGRRWTRLEGVDGLAFGAGRVQALVTSDAGWLAAGVEFVNPELHRTHVLQSPDRIVWKEIGGPVSDLDFASDGHRTVAPGVSESDRFPFPHTVAWSDDARTWTEAIVAVLGRFESGGVIGASSGGFAMAGQRFKPEDESSHAIGWWSTDGATWQPSTFQVLNGPAGEAAPREMIGTDDGLIARGNGDPLANAIWISDVGRTWQQVAPLPPGEITAFARDGDAILIATQPGSGPGVLWRGTAMP